MDPWICQLALALCVRPLVPHHSPQHSSGHMILVYLVMSSSGGKAPVELETCPKPYTMLLPKKINSTGPTYRKIWAYKTEAPLLSAHLLLPRFSPSCLQAARAVPACSPMGPTWTPSMPSTPPKQWPLDGPGAVTEEASKMASDSGWSTSLGSFPSMPCSGMFVLALPCVARRLEHQQGRLCHYSLLASDPPSCPHPHPSGAGNSAKPGFFWLPKNRGVLHPKWKCSYPSYQGGLSRSPSSSWRITEQALPSSSLLQSILLGTKNNGG